MTTFPWTVLRIHRLREFNRKLQDMLNIKQPKLTPQHFNFKTWFEVRFYQWKKMPRKLLRINTISQPEQHPPLFCIPDFEMLPKTSIYFPRFCSPQVTQHDLLWGLWQPCWLCVPLPPTLSFSPVSHFNAELVQSVRAMQKQPSRLSTPSHHRQEVARAAARNSAWDFVWVTYIMAP